MAEKIEMFSRAHRTINRTSKYNWTEWLDGSMWRLEPEDYTGKQLTMVMMLRTHAKKRGLKVRVYPNKETGQIELQAYKPEAGEVEESTQDQEPSTNGEAHEEPEANQEPETAENQAMSRNERRKLARAKAKAEKEAEAATLAAQSE